MTLSRLCGVSCAAIIGVSFAACSGGEGEPETPSAGPVAATPAPTAAGTNNPCPLTVEQVTGITGVPMTLPPGGCQFFPANGRDIPHVFYILQNPMVCSSIQPSDIGFTEPVAGFPAGTAYVRDQIDGTHVLVCPNDNTRGFDIVVDIANDKARNRELAIALAKQVQAGR